MIRYLGLAFVILGLITQPLVAAMPAQVMGDNKPSSMVPYADAVGQKHNKHVQTLKGSAKDHCHEKSVDELSSNHCKDCDNNCDKGLCACSCISGCSVTISQKTSITLDLKGSITLTSIDWECPDALPSTIFHPPKHS